MKTAFNIPPLTNNFSDISLLIEVSKTDISFLLYSKLPAVLHGFFAYHFEPNIIDDDVAQNLNSIVDDEPTLQQKFANTTILYNTNQVTFLPNSYFKVAEKENICNTLFGVEKNAYCFNEQLQNEAVTTLYRVPQKLYDTVNTLFTKNNFSHTLTVQSNSQNNIGNVLHCIVYNNYIKIILLAEGKLQIAQYLPYNTSADVCYHLLNICTQFNIPLPTVQLLLNGMVDEFSALYKEIYKYFLNIALVQVPASIEIKRNLKEQPQQFYSNLATLTTCV